MADTLESQQIEIAGKKYLTGFYWINVNQKRGWEVEAKDKATRYKRSLCLLRIGRYKREPFQYGLHSGIADVKTKKLPRSLALSVINAFPGRNYLGIFALNEGWWVCVVQNAQFMLQGDTFFSDKEEAKAFFEENRNRFNWTEDNVFDFSDSREDSLKELSGFIDESEYANKSGYINFEEKKQVNFGAILLVLLILAGGGVWMYQDELFPKETIPPKPANVLFPFVWEKMPAAWDVYMACEEALNTLPLTENLWTMREATCTPKNLTAIYSREKDGSYLYPPKGTKIDVGKMEQVTRTIPIKINGKREKAAILPQKKLYIELREYFRIMNYYGATAALNSVAPEKTQDGEPPMTVTANFAKINYRIVASKFPREIYHYIAKLPGATLETLKTKINRTSLSWEFSGNIYVKPER